MVKGSSQMPVFKVLYSGDYFDQNGDFVRPDIGLDLLANVPFIQTGSMTDQQPQPDDPTYWDRLYSLQVTPEHVASANGLIICRPWVKASAFSQGAENLVAIGRGGAGYDKIDLEACTANDVFGIQFAGYVGPLHRVRGVDLHSGFGQTPS